MPVLIGFFLALFASRPYVLRTLQNSDKLGALFVFLGFWVVCSLIALIGVQIVNSF